jgi:hypothetical protein
MGDFYENANNGGSWSGFGYSWFGQSKWRTDASGIIASMDKSNAARHVTA